MNDLMANGRVIVKDFKEYLKFLDTEIHCDPAPQSIIDEADYALKLISGKDFKQWHEFCSLLEERLCAILEKQDDKLSKAFTSEVPGWIEFIKDFWSFNNQATVEAPKLIKDAADLKRVHEIFIVRGEKAIKAIIEWFESITKQDDDGDNALESTMFIND